ncbi:Ethanolamine-phosphate cytidylyltransferase [Seminavis robusta]|uniref:ethanolamine-phosphate cytidylyltransferase n=1 Tax=Seminavis robusta TaxID=568900 RepID=A0A9N8E9H1_9STRA|nr:Ethanolamine-phosphate cytidylyltransferase [Seminavis robusta]|eukprot:Sro774_g200620.1 Ethanolamine-phosphate cytidylyltransferase (523) ;mRNA; f:12503-14071
MIGNHDDEAPPADSAVVPKMGPEPTLLCRKEVDALYETLQAIVTALDQLQVDYIVTGGSLLGAIRQHSILFCDDDIDVTIIDYPPGHPRDPYTQNRKEQQPHVSAYERVSQNLQELLGPRFTYSIRPWEAGDKVRPRFMSSIFVDIFTLRRFDTLQDLRDLMGVKTNGQPQPQDYVDKICDTITSCAILSSPQSQQPQTIITTPLCPFWQFNTRKAVELWPKEVYREHELFPLDRNLKFGPFDNICGPKMPVLLLQRAFGHDCFEVYYASVSHKDVVQQQVNGNDSKNKNDNDNKQTNGTENGKLPPRTLAGGIWESSPKCALQDQHLVPMQPTSRALRRPDNHNRHHLEVYLQEQTEREELWQREEALRLGLNPPRPRRTIYMDGVFDMFHIGHLQAIQQCAAWGDRVILGLVSDEDAKGYKRPPIIPQEERLAIVSAIRYVDQVICPNPFIVTQEFMDEHQIDLVVHGFADPADEERQREFFEVPRRLGKFRTIRYHQGLSTTDIIARMQSLPPAHTLEP